MNAPSLRTHRLVALVLLATAACVGDDASDGVSVRVDALTVGGYDCPTHGEIAGRTIPADHRYDITTFGGGADTQPMACGGIADGRALYIADSWRFGCHAHVRVSHPTNGRSCVALVGDVGPNICVEQAAGRAVIDASPAITQYLFGISSSGWAERRIVVAELVAASVPLGCSTDSPDGGVAHPDAGSPTDAVVTTDASAPHDAVVDASAAHDVSVHPDVLGSDARVDDAPVATDVVAADVHAPDAASSGDASRTDAIADDAAPTSTPLPPGCACSTLPARGPAPWLAPTLLLAVLCGRIRRRRS